MEDTDIEIFLKMGYWPNVTATMSGKKWRATIQKRSKGKWIVDSKRLFSNPYKAYAWITEYLSEIYYTAAK